jgi:hypothetical protein
MFRDIKLCSPLQLNLRFGGTCPLHLQGLRSSVCYLVLAWLILLPWRWRRHVSFETLVDFQRTTRCYILDDRTLHKPCRENLKSYIFISILIFDFAQCAREPADNWIWILPCTLYSYPQTSQLCWQLQYLGMSCNCVHEYEQRTVSNRNLISSLLTVI